MLPVHGGAAAGEPLCDSFVEEALRQGESPGMTKVLMRWKQGRMCTEASAVVVSSREEKTTQDHPPTGPSSQG